MQTAAKINERVNKSTAQGTYVFAADGTAYGYNNNRSVERLTQMLDKSLKAFGDNQPADVDIPKSVLDAPWNTVPDATTTVVRIFTRVRPVPNGAPEANKIVARDHFWILQNEVSRIIESGKLPDTLVNRLVRFHLVDNVRGEPDMWMPREVKACEFSLQKRGGVYEMNGSFRMRTADNSRGFEGKLTGEFSIDKTRIKRFRAFVEGTAWGHGTYTEGAPSGKFSIVQGMLDVNDAFSKVVPPQAIFFGSEYFNPKIEITK